MKRLSTIAVYGVCILVSLATRNHASADAIHTDNLIIQGNLCIGMECWNSELFTSAVKLKENNNRINFIDQTAVPFNAIHETDQYSISGTMEGAWRIEGNESLNDGRNAFIASQQSLATYPAVSNGTAIDYECSYTGNATAVGQIPPGQPVETQVWAGNDPASTDCQLLNSEIRLDSIIIEGNTHSSGAALGYRAIPADGTLSIGADEVRRRLVHIAKALQDTDLINKRQLDENIMPEKLASVRRQLRQLDREILGIEIALGMKPPIIVNGSGGGSSALLLMAALLGLRRRS